MSADITYNFVKDFTRQLVSSWAILAQAPNMGRTAVLTPWMTNHHIGPVGPKMVSKIPPDVGQTANFFPYMGGGSIDELLHVMVSQSGVLTGIYGT